MSINENLSVSEQFSQTYGVTRYGSGWRKETYGVTSYETYGITNYDSVWRKETYGVTSLGSGWRMIPMVYPIMAVAGERRGLWLNQVWQ